MTFPIGPCVAGPQMTRSAESPEKRTYITPTNAAITATTAAAARNNVGPSLYGPPLAVIQRRRQRGYAWAWGPRLPRLDPSASLKRRPAGSALFWQYWSVQFLSSYVTTLTSVAMVTTRVMTVTHVVYRSILSVWRCCSRLSSSWR